MTNLTTPEIPLSRLLELATNPRYESEKLCDAVLADVGLYIMCEFDDVVCPAQLVDTYVDETNEVRVSLRRDDQDTTYDRTLVAFAQMAYDA